MAIWRHRSQALHPFPLSILFLYGCTHWATIHTCWETWMCVSSCLAFLYLAHSPSACLYRSSPSRRARGLWNVSLELFSTVNSRSVWAVSNGPWMCSQTVPRENVAFCMSVVILLHWDVMHYSHNADSKASVSLCLFLSFFVRSLPQRGSY